MASTALTLHVIDGEPRVLDMDLAAKLEMIDPHKIRPLIRANLDELTGLGDISACRAETGKPGRPATAYYLNEQQALLLVMFSRTGKAAEVRREVIEVFVAWRRGELEARKPVLPDFTNPVLAARAWADATEAKLLAEHRAAAQAVLLAEQAPMVEAVERMVSVERGTLIGRSPPPRPPRRPLVPVQIPPGTRKVDGRTLKFLPSATTIAQASARASLGWTLRASLGRPRVTLRWPAKFAAKL